MEEGAYSAAEQLLIAVTSELMGKSTGLVSKGEKCKTCQCYIKQDTVFCAGNNMLIVVKPVTAGESMEFLRCICSLGLRSIRRVTRLDRREARVWVVEGGNNLLVGHAFQFNWGAELGRDVVAVVGTLDVLD